MSQQGFNPSPGGFNRTMYDCCQFNKKLQESTSPLQYRMYAGNYENCNKCIFDENSYYMPFSPEIVDMESELKNISRRYSRCPQNKYLPGCKSRNCIDTFDKNVPIVLAQENCPIIFNNIPKVKRNGLCTPSQDMCLRPNSMRQRRY